MRNKNLFFSTILLGLSILLAPACSEEGNRVKGKEPPLPTLTDAQLKALSGKTFYFAHQSVGYNIVEGVGKVLERMGRPDLLRIKELQAGQSVPPAGLLHSTVGRNGDPLSKMAEFQSFLDDRLGEIRPDMAMLKFCYLDITEETDVPVLVRKYDEALSSISEGHADTAILYSTVPLRVFNGSWKAKLKRFLGMEVWGDAANITRDEFNEKIREKYAATGRLADIADWESRYPDGRPHRVKLFGKEYAELIPEYSYDGKHLNSYGQQVVAGRLLEFLARLVTEEK